MTEGLQAKGSGASTPKSSRVIGNAPKRGMPAIKKPMASVVETFEGWLRDHLSSGREVSRYIWGKENLEFEHFILSRNALENRDLKEKNLRAMVRWRLSGRDFFNYNDAICFSVTGNLETGQHRAIAGIRAGLGSRHVVMIGPPAFANQQDLGLPLTAKDSWKREGISKSYINIRSGMIRALLMIEAGSTASETAADDLIQSRGETLNGSKNFEEAIEYATQAGAPPFSSRIFLGVAHYLIMSTNHHGPAARDYLEEIFSGTKRTSHKKNINSLRAYLERIDTNIKSRDKLFRSRVQQNFRALNAIILSWRSYPKVPITYVWEDRETLIPDTRK